MGQDEIKFSADGLYSCTPLYYFGSVTTVAVLPVCESTLNRL